MSDFDGSRVIKFLNLFPFEVAEKRNIRIFISICSKVFQP